MSHDLDWTLPNGDTIALSYTAGCDGLWLFIHRESLDMDGTALTPQVALALGVRLTHWALEKGGYGVLPSLPDEP